MTHGGKSISKQQDAHFRFPVRCGVLILMILAAIPLKFAAAQELGSLSWFQSQWQTADSLAMPEGIFLHYSMVLPVQGDAEDLQALADEISGYPDHPKRKQYEALHRQLEHGPRTITYRLWYKEPKRWRLAVDYAQGDPLPHFDSAVNGGEAWHMTPRELRLVDPNRPPEGMDPFSRIAAVPAYYRAWVGWNLSIGPLDLQPTTAKLMGDRWEGTARSPDGEHEFRYLGTLDGNRIRFDRIIKTRSGNQPEWIGAETVFSDWQYSEFLDRWIAGSVLSSSSKHNQTQVLHELRPLREDEWQTLVATPKADGNDPIRGEATFVSIVDLRPGSHHVDVLQPDGTTTRTRITASPIAAGQSRWVRVFGWVLVGAIAGVLVWFRIRHPR